MYKLSKTSKQRLATCDQRLQTICKQAAQIYNFTVLCGHRGQYEQDILYQNNKTKLQYPSSKHNKTPSQAIDIAPYPIDWDEITRFHILAGIIFGIAHSKQIKLRWGGDWNNNWDLNDQGFDDLVHFELVTK